MVEPLVLEINAKGCERKGIHVMPGEKPQDPDRVLMITPPVGAPDYWLFRVRVSETQDVVAFPKFTTVGIGFAREEDWNTNLPYSCDADEIYRHIEHNRAGADPARCRAAIRMLQEAVARGWA